MKITRRQLRRIIAEAKQPGEAFDYDNMPDDGWGPDNSIPPVFTADAGKGFKPDVDKMNKLKNTKFKLNSLNDFVKYFFDDNKPEFDSKQLVLKILNLKEAADQGFGEYDENEKKEIEKALELAEEATGFVASDKFLTQRGKDIFSAGGKYDPEIEKSNYFRRKEQGYSIERDKEINDLINENSKKLNRRHLRRLIKEELKKRLLSESYNLEHRVNLFLNYGNSYRETGLRGDIGSSSGTYDATTADEWDREEPWFNDALMFRMTLDSIDTFYRTTKAFTDFSEVSNMTPQTLANFILKKIEDAKAMISQGHEFIYEPEAISMYLDAVAKKLNTL